MIRQLSFWILVLLAGFSPPTWAWKKITPTAVEYDAWPDICKSSQFLTIPPDKVRPIISEHEGEVLWSSGGWHYCTGLLKVRRAELMPRTSEMEDTVKDALKDINYSFEKIDKDELWSAEMAVTAARAHRLLKQVDDARRYLKFAQDKHPEYGPTYMALAMLAFDEADYGSAIEALQTGLRFAEDHSGELHYFLGLAYVRVGDYENAKRQEHIARSRGYPLQGLARKIAQYERGTAAN